MFILVPASFSQEVFTDKSAYNPGDVVFIHGDNFPLNREIILQIDDSTSKTKLVEQVETSNTGYFSLEYRIPANSLSGYQTVYASSGNIKAKRTFSVGDVNSNDLKSCPYECCVDMIGYEEVPCHFELVCHNHLCKEEDQINEIEIPRKLLFWITLAMGIPLIAFIIFSSAKKNASKIPEY